MVSSLHGHISKRQKQQQAAMEEVKKRVRKLSRKLSVSSRSEFGNLNEEDNHGAPLSSKSRSGSLKKISNIVPESPTPYSLKIPQKILILSLTNSGFQKQNINNLEYLLTWSILCELVALGRATTAPYKPKRKISSLVQQYRLVVNDSSSTGNEILDMLLYSILDKDYENKSIAEILKEIVQADFNRKLTEKLLTNLVEAGILKVSKNVNLGFFSFGSFPLTDKSIKSEIRQEISDAVVRSTNSMAPVMYALAFLLKSQGVLDAEINKSFKDESVQFITQARKLAQELDQIEMIYQDKEQQIMYEHITHILSEYNRKKY